MCGAEYPHGLLAEQAVLPPDLGSATPAWLFQHQTGTWGSAAVHLALCDQAQTQADASRAVVYVAESLIRYCEIGH